MVVCDVLKTAFSLACLGQTSYITLWFFLVLADGHFIYILEKLIALTNINSIVRKEVKMSRNKMFGILLVMLSNIFLTLFWQSYACTVAGGYLLFSCAEYCLLESATLTQKNTLYTYML